MSGFFYPRFCTKLIRPEITSGHGKKNVHCRMNFFSDKTPKNPGRIKLIFVFILFLVEAVALAQGYATGDTLYGRNHYIEYMPGDLPVIFAAPHGGNLQPEEIPDRSFGTMVTDSYTRETVMAIRDIFFEKTGHYPHVIISRLKRTKLDPNREIEEAAQGNPYAERAWREYHGFIDNARDSITIHIGAGLFVDIHGHGHPDQRLELGYLISGAALRQSDRELNSAAYVRHSSLRHLARYTPDTFAGLLRGAHSLGTLFEQRGIPAVPSENQPSPGVGEFFFSGGYSTRRHGSQSGGVIDAVQIEAWYTGLRDRESARRFFAETMIGVLNDFVRYHYGWSDLSHPTQPIPPPATPVTAMRIATHPVDSHALILYTLNRPTAALGAVLYNSSGQRVAVFPHLPGSLGKNRFRLNTSTLSSGLYFFTLRQTGRKDCTLKILVLH